MLSKPSFIFSEEVAVASAVPPTWVSIAPRIMFCAPRRSPDSLSDLIFSFSWSVKVTPERARAVIPFTGSFRALPSAVALLSAEPKPVAARSMAALVARSKEEPVSSAVSARPLKVRSLAWVCLITSASVPSVSSLASA